APVCLLATLACRPEAAVQEPSPEPASEADRGGPTAANEDDANETEPDVDVEEGEATEPSTDVVAEAGADEQPEPASEEKPEPVASAETKTRAPLPKAIHKPGNGKCVQKFAVGEKVKGF